MQKNTTYTNWSIIEETVSVEDAIRREKQLKKWSRNKKISLIESINPNWANLMSK